MTRHVRTGKRHVTTLLFSIYAFCCAAQAATAVKANQYVWEQFSAAERIALMGKFPDIELVPLETVGVIQSAQVVDRSTSATHGGAALGSAVGQAAYIDHAFKGSGSNYSAGGHLGAALLGAVIGSTHDKPAQARFFLNYGVKTVDGQVREVRVESADEFTRPLGQCIYLADMTEAAPALCEGDKVQFLKQLSTMNQPTGTTPEEIARSAAPKTVSCRVPNVGLMTLDPAACHQLAGAIEK
jgi:hypothetical protein